MRISRDDSITGDIATIGQIFRQRDGDLAAVDNRFARRHRLTFSIDNFDKSQINRHVFAETENHLGWRRGQSFAVRRGSSGEGGVG